MRLENVYRETCNKPYCDRLMADGWRLARIEADGFGAVWILVRYSGAKA